LEEVAVHDGCEVLMEVDNDIALILGDPQEILDQQLRPYRIHLFNILSILLYKTK
jgi:hypothetical protein